ncbi:MAG: caspase family protein [Planctomycetota bacterium]
MRTTLLSILLLCGLVHARPELKYKLCQGWDKNLMPLGATEQFFQDSASVRLVLSAGKAIPEGHVLRTDLVQITAAGKVPLLRGNLQKTNGKGNRYGSGFRLAGLPWAANGGRFALEVYWDDETEPFVSAPFTVQQAQRRALLVGISDYPPKGPGGGDLPSPAEDAERMSQLLQQSFGFAPGNITVVQDLDATADRLRKEIRRLAQESGPNDAVFIYYCGHGTQVPDLDGDEPDGWDEALATADVKPDILTKPGDLKHVLTDDEISELLKLFKTKNVTVIFDSCHSGTAVRAGDEESFDAEGLPITMSRETPVGRKLVEKAQDAQRAKKAPPVASGIDVDQGYVFLSGARSWETGQTNKYGCFFSRALRDEMRRADGKTWEEIIQSLRPRVHRLNVGQTPQAEGAIRRYPFSLAEAPRDSIFDRPSYAVVGAVDPKNPKQRHLTSKPGMVVLVSGLNRFAEDNAGVVCDVHAGGSLGSLSKPHGQVRITGKQQAWQPRPDVRRSYAAAQILSGTVRRGDRLVPRTMRVPDAVPNVTFSFFRRTSKQQIQGMQRALQAMVKGLQANRALRVHLKIPRNPDYFVIPEPKSGKIRATVLTGESEFIGKVEGDGASLARQVSDLVGARHDQFARFNRISNPSPAFRLRVNVVGGDRVHPSGSPVRIRAYAEKPVWVYVLLAGDGKAPYFFTQSQSALAANKEFGFKMTPTKGRRGTLAAKVIASEKPLNLKNVRGADTLLRELRRVHPPKQGGNDFLSTEGWADATVWVDYR